MEQKRCYGCMNLKSTSPVCEHCGYDEQTSNGPHQLPAGTLLRDNYLVGRVLGQGGFGITYLGMDTMLNIPIAIKEYYPSATVLRDSRDGTTVVPISQDSAVLFRENRSRFLREAQTLAQLQDIPEVVQVMNFFEENGTAYIVMGYVRGITLAEYLRRKGGSLNTPEALQLLRPLLEAMGRVHGTGLVHRDIADQMLHDILLDAGLAPWKARLVKWAVHNFAGGHYGPENDKDDNDLFVELKVYSE